MVAFLEKSTGSAGFHQIIDFITRSHIYYALTKKPEVCVSFIKQFWRSAEASTNDNGEVTINATIDGHTLSITEGSLRRHLKLADQDGVTSIPTTELFEQLELMGYHTDSDKLTFQKGVFSPQWRFLIHNILHCLSPKKTAWEQFSSNIATATICLATNRKFNFSRMIFEHMEVALFPNMLAVPTPSTSPSNIISSPKPTQPSHTQPSPQPSPIQPSPTQLSPIQPGTEYHPPTPHDLPLYAVHSHGSDEGSLKLQELMNLITTLSDRIGVLEADLTKIKKTYSFAYTKLILRVKKLEAQIKVGKVRRHTQVVLSDTEVGEDDSSKQGRKFSNEGVQDDEGVHEKASTDTEIFVQEVTPTEVIQDQEGSEKVSDEVSTAGLKKGPVSEEVPTVSTAEATLSTAGGTVTYSRRSAEKRSRKDKGKAILIEEEPKKKSKKDLEQEQLSYAEAIRLEEQMNEEQRAQIARDEEIARQWDEEERKRAMDEAKTTKKIDWNDPSVIRYHSLKMKPKTIAQARRNMIKYLKNQGNFKISDFKGMSYNDIRPIFEKIWDFNQKIVPMDEKSPAKEKSPEKVVEEESETQEELKEGVKEPAAKRKKSIPRKTTRKRQKLEEDAEKDELKGFLDIVPREEAPIEIESLSTKFPIVDWKRHNFDRLDVEELYRLVKNRYSASSPEGFDLMLWGDLHTLFEPDKDDEIWRDQHEYNLLSWRLCDFCGIHILLMDNGLAIHMLTEKKRGINTPPLDISKDQFEGFSDSNDDSTSIDDDSFSIDDIDYVEASPPDSEPVSLEAVEIVIPKVRGIDTDILLTIKDDILQETDISYNSLPESETFCFNLEKKSSGNPTSYSDLSLPDYEAFFFYSEPNLGNFTMDVVEDISDNPTRELYVHVLHDLPTHPTLQLDSDFTLSSDSLGSDLIVYFPSGTKNKIFDPGIFIKVQSKRFLSPNEFSISFIRDPLSPVFDTLLPFSYENEDNVFNPDEEEVTIDAIPLAVKSPRIVDWKIHKEGKKSHYQIIRADGKSQMYKIFSQMIKSFNKEDLEDFMEAAKQIQIVRIEADDSRGVHFLRMQSMQIYLLVENKYPLTPPTLSMMLEKKLQIDYESEMAY
ncbi:hypothetical protein Tco_1501790 [Tanacetum coccineum]